MGLTEKQEREVQKRLEAELAKRETERELFGVDLLRRYHGSTDPAAVRAARVAKRGERP